MKGRNAECYIMSFFLLLVLYVLSASDKYRSPVCYNIINIMLILSKTQTAC